MILPTSTFVADASSYKIYYQEEGSPDIQSKSDITSNPYSLQVDKNNVIYHIYVTAFDAAGNESLKSETKDGVALDNLPPIPPTNIVAADHPGDNGYAIDVTWALSDSSDVIGYQVGISPTGQAGTWSFMTVDKIVNKVTIPVLKNNVIYYFIVQAYDAAGNYSSPNTPILAKALDNILPAIPQITQLKLTCDSPDCQARLEYRQDLLSADTESILLQVATDSTFSSQAMFVQVVQEPPLGFFVIGDLKANKTYYFRLIAADTAGNMAISDFVKGTPKKKHIIKITPAIVGQTEKIETIRIKAALAAKTKTNQGISGGFVGTALAAPATTSTLTPTPTPKVTPTVKPTPTPTGKVGKAAKKNTAGKSNNTLLIILLIAAALAAYFGYRAVSRPETPDETKEKEEKEEEEEEEEETGKKSNSKKKK